MRCVAVAAALCAAFCAVQAYRIARVAEGDPREVEDAPWLVQLVFLDTHGSGKPMPNDGCTGSIVDEKHIITAGHCFPIGWPQRDNPQEYMKVLAGATDKLDMEGGDVYSIKSVARHPKFNDEVAPNQKYDLAVITLTEPIQFNDKVKAIEIAKKQPKGDTAVRSGGWGSTKLDENGHPAGFADTLKTADMTKQSESWCRKYMARTDLHKEASKAMMCMKPDTGIPCVGDSGAGVWVRASDDEPAKLFGVLQGVAACTFEDGIPMVVDILNKDVRKFFKDNGVKIPKE